MKEKAQKGAIAENQHELTRCLEVFDLLDLGELVFTMAMERKETRGRHVRSDYPFLNPLMNKMLVVKKTNDGPAVEWREVNR